VFSLDCHWLSFVLVGVVEGSCLLISLKLITVQCHKVGIKG
jgi:hypothetical protein